MKVFHQSKTIGCHFPAEWVDGSVTSIFGRLVSSTCNKPFGQQSKYVSSNSIEHEQQYFAFRSNTHRVLDVRSHGHIHSGNRSELVVRRGLLTPFFIRPSLEVEIHHRLLPIQSDENLSLPQPPIPDPPYEYVTQSLAVKAKKAAIYKLTSKVWLDGEGGGMHTFSWSQPLRILDPILGRLMIGPSPKHIDLIAEEPVLLPIWTARRTKSGETYLTLNIDPPIGRKLTEFKESHVDIDIQFIAENYTGKKVLKYRLNVKSWDELNLTERLVD